VLKRKKDDVPEISPERLHRFVDTDIDHISIGPKAQEEAGLPRL
jgi:hypothetical protein